MSQVTGQPAAHPGSCHHAACAGKLKASELIAFLQQHINPSADSASRGSSSQAPKPDAQNHEGTDDKAQPEQVPQVVEVIGVGDVERLAGEEDAHLMAFFAGEIHIAAAVTL